MQSAAIVLRVIFGVLAGSIVVGCRARSPATGQCTFNDDCESPLVCFNRVCRQACRSDRDCPTQPTSWHCDPTGDPNARVCLPPDEPRRCVYHSECNVDAGLVCAQDGVCRTQCRTDADCRTFRPGSVCDVGDGGSGVCVVRGDAGMDAGCPAPAVDCAGRCVDLRSDPRACGRCGRDCTQLANVHPTNVTCVVGECSLMGSASCLAGFADCNGDANDGCETDLSQVASCGACGRACAGSTPVCAPTTTDAGLMYACAAGCPAGTLDCAGRCVDTQSDPVNCGACGRACVAPAHMTATCSAGACMFACDAGYADCNASMADGCEVDTRTDDAHCGACGRACSRPNATALCVASTCTLGTCDTGFGDCDGTPANGCEADLRSDMAHCGACGAMCSRPDGTAACVAGACLLRGCAPGRGDCDGNPDNGCETDTQTDATHCGSCGAVCARPNAMTACAGGSCTVTGCSAGFMDCDMAAPNGCEVDTRSDVRHCGGCGTVCATRNATPMCAGGMCRVGMCLGPFVDCDGMPSNGCEANTQTDPTRCGSCMNACMLPQATPACSAGSCAIAACSPTYGDCDGMPSNGCEVATSTDLNHCGGCGRRCARPNAMTACVSGSCNLAACMPGFGNCDGSPANGCEVPLSSSLTHCGACGNTCAAINGTPSCVGGSCLIFCSGFYDNCDGVGSNGCETDLRANVNHCGACGMPCVAPANATATCFGGVCAIVPDPGYSCSMGICSIAPARQIAPLSGHRTTLRRPTLRWALTAPHTGARVQICADAGCGTIEVTADVTGSSFAPAADLSPGPHFWRVFGMIGATAGTSPSPVWTMFIPRRSASSADTSWGTGPDLDGDGLCDVVGGMTAASGGAWWFRGVRSATNVVETAAQPFLAGGATVAGAGDINGDGYADLALTRAAGPLYVYFGGTGRIVTPAQTLTPPAGITGFGTSMATAGDVNGDGFNDLIVGAQSNATALVYMGSAAGLQTPPLALTGPTQFGSGVALAGDVNADGYSDVMVGSCVWGGGPSCSARVFIFHGSATGLSTVAATTLIGTTPAQYGAFLSGAGDVNGDGYDDVALTASGQYRAFVFHGGASGVSTTFASQLDSPGGASYYGWAYAAPGDLDRDGYDDLVLSRTIDARVITYRGSASGVQNGVWVSITGPGSYGNALLGAGDVNGDGFPEVVVGAPGSAPLVDVLNWDGAAMNLRVVGTARALSIGATVAQRWLPRLDLSALRSTGGAG